MRLSKSVPKVPDYFPPGTTGPSPDGKFGDETGGLDRARQIHRGQQEGGRPGRGARRRGEERRQSQDGGRIQGARRLQRLPSGLPRKVASKLARSAVAALLAGGACRCVPARTRSLAVPISPLLPAAAPATPTASMAASRSPGGRAFETPFGTFVSPEHHAGSGKPASADGRGRIPACLALRCAPRRFTFSDVFPVHASTTDSSTGDLADLGRFSIVCVAGATDQPSQA